MKKVKILLALAMCSMYQSCSSDEVNMNPQEESQEKVVFKDDFETFDSNVWTKEEHEAGWVNQELQIYDAAHVSTGTDEGRSVLILTAERKGDKIYSGRVNSQGKKSFQYGKIEASIKHYGTDYESGHRQEYHADNVSQSLQDGKYHTYLLEWNENSLTVSIDGTKFYTFDISKVSGRYEYFHHNFYILFNLAVGGSFTGITDVNAITALKDGEKVNMYIDWIKVY